MTVEVGVHIVLAFLFASLSKPLFNILLTMRHSQHLTQHLSQLLTQGRAVYTPARNDMYIDLSRKN